ncbi:hypothetical protein TWF106_003459 [Orbilia oligospora]|uniref:Uncharacterized protein n=1 Tax=Orbilia oligospora TaxID=2813651 RepID=A0A7C8U880_ORBOL|nr:hypothetical protein TWF106_003459 [Orbilia oligospora]
MGEEEGTLFRRRKDGSINIIGVQNSNVKAREEEEQYVYQYRGKKQRGEECDEVMMEREGGESRRRGAGEMNSDEQAK